jgi:ElaB/YqjD/DUF883 family membrane-anchored ribosome-binding protein
MTNDFTTSHEVDPYTSADAERVDELASEIEATRGDLSDTVHAIGDKLEPGNLARDAGETVKQAAMGKVDAMTYGAQETWRDISNGNTRSLIDTIKDNPVPAGMVAAGIGLLLMNRGQKSQSGYRPVQARPWEQYGGPSAADRIGSTMSGAADQVGQTAGQVGDKLGGVAGSMGQTASEFPQQAGYAVSRATNQVARFLDENPLGAGLIAVAAGATVGLLLPSTPIEREKLGETRDQLVSQVETTAHEAIDKVEAGTQQG